MASVSIGGRLQIGGDVMNGHDIVPTKRIDKVDTEVRMLIRIWPSVPRDLAVIRQLWTAIKQESMKSQI